jgi:predicted ATPase
VRDRAGEADACYRFDEPDDVRLTRSFLEDPQRFLRHRLDD